MKKRFFTLPYCALLSHALLEVTFLMKKVRENIMKIYDEKFIFHNRGGNVGRKRDGHFCEKFDIFMTF